VCIVVLSLMTHTSAQMGMGQSKDKGKVLPKDLPFIACEVCRYAVANIYDDVEDARKNAPYKKIDELLVQDVLDGSCNPKDKYGSWIREIDIDVNDADPLLLELKHPGGLGKCEHECKTVAQSCKDLLEDDLDRDDLSGLLWKGKHGRDAMLDKVCTKMTKRCSPGPKRMSPKRSRKDYPFLLISEKDLEMEQLMATMEASGVGGVSMMGRDEMDQMAGGYGGDPYGDPYGGMGGMGGMGGYGDMDMEAMMAAYQSQMGGGGMDSMGGGMPDMSMMGGDDDAAGDEF